MGEKRPDGGPAFPGVVATEYVASSLSSGQGMSLRDKFAEAQLIAMGTWTPPDKNGEDIYPPYDQDEVRRLRAEYAYAQADAMLAQREKSR